MASVHINKKQEATRLRLEGKSYGEILKILDIPSKGTLSAWFKKLKLSKKAKLKLEKNYRIAHEQGLFKFNAERTRNILAENKAFFEETANLIPMLSKTELLLIGAALYWGEGTLRERPGYSPIVSFTNSDPQMVKIFLRFLREILNVEEERIRAGVQLHQNIKPEVAKKFWSRITKLPQERFYTFDQVSKISKFKRHIHFLPHGTITIRVNSRRLFYRVKGYINGIGKQLTKD